MAKMDVMTINGKKTPCLNISESVGANGANKFADVLLIQALFNYIAPIEPMFQQGAVNKPALNGFLDADTIKAIFLFQGLNAHRLLKTDGVIQPAAYANRNLKNIHARLMTITLLHLKTQAAARHHAHENYAKSIFMAIPKLLPFITAFKAPQNPIACALAGV